MQEKHEFIHWVFHLCVHNQNIQLEKLNAPEFIQFDANEF